MGPGLQGGQAAFGVEREGGDELGAPRRHGIKIVGFNRDSYINLNFTLFLEVFLRGPWGPQGLIN